MLNKIAVKDKTVIVKNNVLPEWISNTPKDIRLHACWEFVTSFNTNIKLEQLHKNRIEYLEKLKETNKKITKIIKPRKKFEFNFRKKKSTQCITLDKSACSFFFDEEDNKIKFSTYKTLLSGINLKLKHYRKMYKDNIGELEHDVKLLYNGVHYWLLIPVKISKENKKAKDSFISLDPGVRSIVTGYTGNQGIDFKINHGKLNRDLNKLDNARSLQSKKIITRKQRLLKEIRLTEQIKTLHVKISKYLTKRFDKIIIGKINSHDIVKTSNNKTLNRSIMTLCLYKFRKRLEFDCYKRNRKFVLTNEAYTSKICGSCGFLHKELGASKYFDCPNCNYTSDRDLNASRNILSKFIASWVRKEEIPLG